MADDTMESRGVMVSRLVGRCHELTAQHDRLVAALREARDSFEAAADHRLSDETIEERLRRYDALLRDLDAPKTQGGGE